MIIRALALALLLLPAPALAQDRTRVDLYDAQSRRQGYAIIDRERGTVDTYDADSKRTGYGVIRPDGRVDVYRPDGTRKGGVVPSRPKR